MRVRLVSGQIFSHSGELWLAGSHGGGITSGMSYIENRSEAVGIGRRGLVGIGIGGGGVSQ